MNKASRKEFIVKSNIFLGLNKKISEIPTQQATSLCGNLWLVMNICEFFWKVSVHFVPPVNCKSNCEKTTFFFSPVGSWFQRGLFFFWNFLIAAVTRYKDII